MLYYFTFFNLVRQGIAVSLTTFSLVYLEKKKIVFIIISLIAVMFHYSAIIVLVLSPLIMAKYTQKGYYISFLFIPVICILSYLFSQKFINNSLYANYIEEIEYKFNYLQVLKEFFVCGLCVVFFNKIKSKTSIADYLINIQFVTLFLYCLIGIPYINRITVYFKISQILLFPVLFSCIQEKKLRVFFSSMFVLIWFVLCFYYIGILGYIDVLPYKTIFSK
jgi:hypothetical protein